MNQTTQNSNQNRMSEPPNVISTKDLSYLKDAMAWELLATKKCRHYSSICTDQELKGEIDKVGQKHQQHYDKLLKYLQSNPNQKYMQ